jgi:glycosyltransferase involved in cell wall biosynthesis
MTSAPLPVVSIVTPAYNSAAYIAETVESVLRQTWPAFELLIVDDGSTDDTLDVASAVAGDDARVKSFSSPHGGPAIARNIGLQHASGEFIALLDSDDVWDPRYLSEQVALLRKQPEISIVSANVVSRGGPLDGTPFWPITSGTHELQTNEPIAQEDAVSVFAVFRRTVIERIGGFDPTYTGNEDYEFWLRAMNAGFRVLQNRAVLGRYRRRPGSVSSDDVRMLNGIIAVLESAGRLQGRLEADRALISHRLRWFREELVKAEVRSSLERRDGVTASERLRALSRLRKDWRLAAGAWLAGAWPDLAVSAYGLRRTLLGWRR